MRWRTVSGLRYEVSARSQCGIVDLESDAIQEPERRSRLAEGIRLISKPELSCAYVWLRLSEVAWL